MAQSPEERELDRIALVRRVMRALVRDRKAALVGEPGVGVGWLARRVAAQWPGPAWWEGTRLPSARNDGADLVILRPRDGAPRTAARLVLGGTSGLFVPPLTALQALVRRRLEGLPLAVEATLDLTSLEAIAARCDGLPALACSAATWAGRLGSEATLAARDGEAPFRLSLGSIASEARAIEELAALAVFVDGFDLEDAQLVLGGAARRSVPRLAAAGWLRPLGRGRHRVGHWLGRAASEAAPTVRARAESVLSEWGERRAHAVTRRGGSAAPNLVALHTTFRRIGREVLAGPPTSTSVAALLACLAQPNEDPRELVALAAHALATLTPEAIPRDRETSLAIGLAECARALGLGTLADEALARAKAAAAGSQRREAMARALCLEARLRFNRSRFDEALAAVDQAEALAQGDREATALAQLTRAWIATEALPIDAARAASRQAARALEHLGSPVLAIEARLAEMLLDLSLGRVSAARRMGRALLGDAARLDAGSVEGTSASLLTVACELLGDVAGAERAIARAMSTRSPPLFVALWRGYRGRVALRAGDPERAIDDLAHATDALSRLGAGPSASTFAALLALAHARKPDAIEAERGLERARAHAPPQGVRRVMVELAEAVVRRLLASWPKPGEVGQRDAEAQALLDRHRPREGERHAIHLRAFVAVADRCLDEARARIDQHETLVVSRDGAQWAYRGQREALSSATPLRRLLAALIEARATGSAAVGSEALIAAGWPSERIRPQAARNRLHVALSQLRRSGLDPVITRADPGYRLDPAIALSFEEDALKGTDRRRRAPPGARG